jgi:hypothetical protein
MAAAPPKIGTYLRHSKTGDLARVVEHEGKMQIKPDLPGSPVYYPMTRIHEFNVEESPKKLPPGSWARVAYEAHRALCEIHPEMKRQPEWLNLHPSVKAAWIERRHKFENVLQLELHNLISDFLDKHS